MVPIHATLHSLLLVNIKTFITSPIRVNPIFILTHMKQQAESKTHDFLNKIYTFTNHHSSATIFILAISYRIHCICKLLTITTFLELF